MPAMPSAELTVTAEQVRHLLAAQHPDLADQPIGKLANGWDNVLFRIGDDLLARLPRREAGVRLLLQEQRWLTILAPRLPLPVPAPVRIGQPGSGYPWPWSIVPFVPGEPAAVAPLDDTRGAAIALAGFLRQLHQTAPNDAPVSPHRGVPLRGREDGDRRNLAAVSAIVDAAAVAAVWEKAKVAAPWHRPLTWLHGDLHPLNILVHDGRLSGVIDFGDLTSGDPATDLSAAWMLFDDPRDRQAFLDSYQADDATRARAMGWAITFAVVFLAHSADNPLMAAIGRRGYRNVVTPS